MLWNWLNLGRNHFESWKRGRIILKGSQLNFCFKLLRILPKNPTANIIFNGESLNAFHLKSGIKQWCPLSPVAFCISLEAWARETGQEKEIKGIDWKEKSVLIYSWHGFLRRRSPGIYKLTPKTNKWFSKVARYKISTHNKLFVLSVY